MTPAQKIAAGKCAVGYMRVSSREQTDGWSLKRQEAEIRAWAQQNNIPLIAVVTAPDGWESGKDFDDRVGWKLVEEHLAGGTVGWIVVAAIDRLSRNLSQLAERMRTWENLDIAVVAPGIGYGDPAGVGRFFLHLHGLLAEHERERLIGRVLPGMKARVAAGLPLGRLPMGYRLVAEPVHEHQKSQVRMAPDPATAPIVTALFEYALRHPEMGDRRLAVWAKQRWPLESWSPGRITSILTNPVYMGLLAVSIGTDDVNRHDNHPPLLPVLDFLRLQSLRQQRAGDSARGLDAVRAASWLGGIVRCGKCGGSVTWREGVSLSSSLSSPPRSLLSDASGRYECRGQAASHGCGTVWSKDIEILVQRALECLLENEAGCLRELARNAVEQLPAQLDERRKQADADLTAISAAEIRMTTELAEGRMDGGAYAKAIESLNLRRTAAETLLTAIDGWTYLAQLIMLRDGPGAGTLRWVTIQEAMLRLSLPEKRRLLHALSPSITLEPPGSIGGLDGPGEDHQRGIFTGVRFDEVTLAGPISVIAQGMSRLLATEPGHDVAGGLERWGWTPQENVTGTKTWTQGESASDAILSINLNNGLRQS